MAINSESSTSTAPVERIKRIKDIAASRKEDRGKHLSASRQTSQQPAYVRPTSGLESRANRRSFRQENYVSYQSRDRKSNSKDSFADEFAKMGRVGEDSNKGALRRTSRSDERNRGSSNSTQPTKPRWNSSTCKKVTNSQLHTEHEPIIKSMTRKYNASPKYRSERQFKLRLSAKPSENPEAMAIPTIRSSILEETRQADTKDLEFIKRFQSDPILSSTRLAPSTKLHRERCCVFQPTQSTRPDTPYNPKQNVYLTRRARKRMEVLSAVPDKQIDEAEESRKIFEEAMKEKLQDLKTKNHGSHNTSVSRIPVPSKTYTVVHNRNLEARRYLFDAQGRPYMLMNTVPEAMIESEKENNPPCRNRPKTSNNK